MQVTTDQTLDRLSYGSRATHSPAEQVASLLAWWSDAGVDVATAEQPRNWLDTAAGPKVPARVAVASVSVPPQAVALPESIAAFREWLAADETVLARYPRHCRVAPAGNAASGLMLVAEIPERGDVEGGQLLGGEVGALLDRMLAAVGHSRATAYLATVAPARPPGGRLSDEDTDALAASVRRHVQLVRPAKLWLLGRAATRAVLRLDELAAGGRIHDVNLDGVTMDAIATLHPRVLLANPKFKARVWADMQRLFEDRPE